MEKREEYEGTIDFNPIIEEELITNSGNVLLSVFLSILAIAGLITTVNYFELGLEDSLKATAMTALALAIILFILIKPSTVRKIKTKEIQTITQQVLHPIDRPVEVIKEVIKEVEKPVVEKSEKKKERFTYQGSTQTGTYHKTSCRLSKLIKNKYKVVGNTNSEFRKRGFKPCKVCCPDRS